MVGWAREWDESGKNPWRNPSKSAPVVEKFNFSIGFYPQGVCIIRVWPLEPNSEKSKKRLPDGSPKDPKKIPKRSQKEPQMIPKRPQNDPKTIPSGSQAIPREPQSLPKCLPWSLLETPREPLGTTLGASTAKVNFEGNPSQLAKAFIKN